MRRSSVQKILFAREQVREVARNWRAAVSAMRMRILLEIIILGTLQADGIWPCSEEPYTRDRARFGFAYHEMVGESRPMGEWPG